MRIGAELPSSSMVARRIGTYRFACCAAPDFLARHGTPGHPGDLERARCILNLNLIPRNRWTFLDAGGGATDGGGGRRHRDRQWRGPAGHGHRWRRHRLPAARPGGATIWRPLVQMLADWALPTLPIHTVHPSRHLVPRRVSAFIDAVADGFRGSEVYRIAASTSAASGIAGWAPGLRQARLAATAARLMAASRSRPASSPAAR